MIGKGVIHQMIVFFTCKNCLVFVLQLYRLSIIATAKKEDEDEDDTVIPNPNVNTVKALIAAQKKFKMPLTKPENQSSKVVPSTDGAELPQA